MKIGNLDISSFKIGGADCSIYLGSVKLYPTEEPTPPTPLNVITYEASEKLTETTTSSSGGLHTNRFSGSSGQRLAITSHTFENGVGTIEFDGDITSIGTRAFNSCINITSVNIPNSVTSIGNLAFNSCTNLTSVTIPNSVTSVGKSAFYNCTSLTSIDIPNSVTSISDSAFYNCTSLTSIDIPNSVTSIGDSAFYNCTSLTSIDIPSSVINIGKSDVTFENVPWWSVYSADTSHHYGNIIYINDVAYQATSTTITSCEFKNGTVSISNEAFNECRGLTSIDIPSSVTNISNRAFYNCSSFTSVTVEPTIPPTLGNYAFDNTNNCPIYVPSASVDAYKSATNWSRYASRIQAIP